MKPQQQELGDTERRYEPQPVVRRGRGHMGGGGGGLLQKQQLQLLGASRRRVSPGLLWKL